MLQCDANYWGDKATRLCSNVKTDCTNNTFADPQQFLCVPGTSCTAGTYADPSTNGCESSCSNSSEFGDMNNNLCVSRCS